MLKEITCKWMEKAVDDLEVAEEILESHPGASTFHSQQAGEKALKALLVSLGIHPPKSHDIGYLLSLLEENNIDTTIPRRLGAEKLTGYAVEVRYPDFEEEPDAEEAREALRIAEKMVEWVGERLREKGIKC